MPTWKLISVCSGLDSCCSRAPAYSVPPSSSSVEVRTWHLAAERVVSRDHIGHDHTSCNMRCHVVRTVTHRGRTVQPFQLAVEIVVLFFGPERRVPKSRPSCYSCSWNQFSKNPQGFLNTPHRSTVSDFPLIF